MPEHGSTQIMFIDKDRMEIYFSTDIETDGPIPGPHSMLSMGCVALDGEGTRLGTFSANLQTLPEATGYPETMAWWATQPDAWQACRCDTEDPERVLRRYVDWVDSLTTGKRRPVFVAWPTGFDFMFVYWYMIRFVGRSPFRHSALDMRSFAMAHLKQNYWHVSKRSLPAQWKPEQKHTHVALDDAIEQGEILCAMLKANRSQP